MVALDAATRDGTSADGTHRVVVDEHEVFLLADAIDSRDEQRALDSISVEFGIPRMTTRFQECLPIFFAILYSTDFFTSAPKVE